MDRSAIAWRGEYGAADKPVNAKFFLDTASLKTGREPANQTATPATDFQFRASPRYRFAPPHRRRRQWARPELMATAGSNRHRFRPVAVRCATRGPCLARRLSGSLSRRSEYETSSPNQP